MDDLLKPLNPGQTQNIFRDGHLTQIQHQRDHVDIVDHFDHGPKPVDAHIVTTVTRDGQVKTSY